MSTPRIVFLAALLALTAGAAVRGADDQVRSDEETCKQANVGSDGPGLLKFFRERTLSEAEQARLGDLIRDLGANSFRARENATERLRKAGRRAVPFLKQAARSPDAEVARRATRCLESIEGNAEWAVTLAAARLLAVRKPAGAAEVVLNYLPFADDESVEEELLTTLGVVGLRGGKADPALLAALKRPGAAQRAAAALVLGRSGDKAHREAVKPLLKDRDAKVRLRAAQGLVAGKEPAAVPVLIDLLADAPTPLAWQAEELLCRLAGERSPAVTLNAGEKEARAECRKAWTAWYAKHGPKLDLARFNTERRLLGRTFLLACDTYKDGQGHVWEIQPDGKMRWELSNVGYPVDGQLLPNQHVLIAEQGARRVTERTMEGKIVWSFEVTNSLVSCQRLSNGNTFIATYTEMMEVTPEKKQVYVRTSQEMIHSAVRLRNGNIAYLLSGGVLVEIDAKGKEVRRVKAESPQVGLVKFEVLPGNRYLVPMQQSGKVVELNAEGKVVWECSYGHVNAVMRLPNGNTLVGSYQNRRVAEINRAGKVVWEKTLDLGLLQVHRR